MFDFSYAFEGDFIETTDGLIFDVKGFSHPKDRIIAYLRYLPLDFLIEQITEPEIKQRLIQLSNSSELILISNYINEKLDLKVDDVRLRNSDKIYIKLYEIEPRYQILSKFAKEFIYFHPNFDFSLQAVPYEKINQIYRPERFLDNFLKSRENGLLNDKGIEIFIRYLAGEAGIDSKFIGITGSKMVNLEKKGESDLDIVIYGYKQSKKVHNFIKKLLNKVKDIPFELNGLVFDNYRNSEERLKKLYSIRDINHNLSFEEFSILENRKFHQFIVNDSDVYVRFLKFNRWNNPYREKFENFKYKTIGRIRIKGLVIKDTDSIFTPVSYIIKLTDINEFSSSETELAFNKSTLKNSQIEIFSLRGKYTEHVKKREKIVVEGKLEKVEVINERKRGKICYYRIIVGQKEDYFTKA